MRAKTPKEYREAWTWHIEQLATLALAAKISYAEYVEIKEDLLTWLDMATTTNYQTENRNGEE